MAVRFVATLSVCALIGCSAAPVDDEGAPTTISAASTSGAGGHGGAGGSHGLCSEDCSTIATPPCLQSVCNEGSYQGVIGQCVIVPSDTRESCDDGFFCTIDDHCDGMGQCAGGPPNDCGVEPGECEEVVCDEASRTCPTQTVVNGTSCQSADLCVTGATCNNGLCTGFTNDCFFEPVPNDCHISVCNPQTGMCEPVPGNEGDPCVDAMDLCTISKTCMTGQCIGGQPKDCSFLTMGCVDGVCDTTNGQCTTQAVPPGGNCAEATDDCNQGICDTMGMCIANPVNQGGPCQGIGCIANETCNNGVCQGGTAITSCTNGDSCCPTGCNISNDTDCLTEILIGALTTGHDGNLGGIAGADAACNAEAAANNWTGTWKAFLSDANQDVKDIVPVQFQNLPVKDLQGQLMFNNWTEVFTLTTWNSSAGYITTFANVEVDEINPVTPPWTDADGWHGSNPDGTKHPTNTCTNWTSNASNVSGQASELDFHYMTVTGQEVHACNTTAAVMCVRVGS